MGVGIGIDSHKASVGVGVVDEVGRQLDAREFPNDPRGHRALLKWVQDQGDDRIIGIEGAGNFGAGVTRFLIAAGETVVEVPAFVTYRERMRTPTKGKSDLSDGIAIAHAVVRGQGLATLERSQVVDDLRLLSDHRDQLVCTRTRLANQVHAELAIVRPGYHERVPKLTAKRHLAAALQVLRGDHSVRADLIRDHLDELRRVDQRIADVTRRLSEKVAHSGTSIAELKGIGMVLAAKILGEVGDVRRIHSQGAFAMLNGTAPIQASSGATKRHRLNRGGNRQLNRALHHMATTLCRCDADTKAYMARRMMEGKSRTEALRCLKRHLSNVVYRRLLADVIKSEIAA